jgi:trimeric autotransporter adhesin
MKNNFSSSKKPKIGFVALLLFFCVLWGNDAMAQDTFTWNGSASNDWATASNWTKTGTAGTDTFPGQTLGRVLDFVVISNGGTPIVASNVNAYGMIRLTISNATGPISGSTLTINSGATLNVSSASITNVTLTGGNLINNGTLNITSSSNAASCFGITCNTPTQLPGSATEYGYSGSGALSINISPNAIATSAAVNVSSVNANSTYKFLFNGATTFNLSNIAASVAFRTAGGASASPLIIGGAGITMGSVGSPIVNGGLFSLGAQSTTTVSEGTTLTLYSASTNLSRGISSFSSAAVATTFTNKGTINILGASTTTGGLFFSTGATANTVVFTINNQGTLNINLNCSGLATAPLSTGNGGGRASGVGSGVFINNTGNITLKNSATAIGTGSAIYVAFAGEAPPVNITNDGTIKFEGSTNNSGSKTTIVNNGIINSNSDFISFSSITNNATGTFNFVRTAATGTNKQVTFIVLSTALASPGATYTDGNGNTHVVVPQKFSFALPNPLITNVLYGANIPSTGTLTKVTGTGDATIAYTSFTTSSANSALTTATTNSGTINTDTSSNLGVISGVTTTSNSIIAPGGSAGKGIVDFAKAAATLTGKTILQISGSATAGVDFDQITNSTVAGTLSVAGTLDITGIYTPAGPVTIDIVTTEATGSLTGTFGTVIGITTGWSVDYTTAGKVQLIYSATSPTATTWTGGDSTGWINPLNWSAGVPDQNSDVTIANGTFQPSSFVNITIKSLTIDSGSSLTINSGLNLTVKEAIINNGTLTITNNANLIQVDNAANTGTGTTTVNRSSNALSRLDYTLWSSPMTNLVPQLLSAFSPATDSDRFYTYNQTTNLYNAIDATATPFAEGTGFLIRMPNDHPTSPTIWNGSFSGVPNNGTINKTITYSGATFGYNMIGNPYPSTIDAQAFIAANTANIESGLYFWRKINLATGSAYAVYNPMGGTTASPSSAVPNGTIQVGQGFFVKAKSASSVNFTNAMRVANTGNQFFKTRATQKDRVWLNLTNASGVYSQALVGYTATATTGVDMYDAKFINDSKVALTSNINGEEYTIQGRPAFDASDVVALNFKTDLAGDYAIALDHFDGVFATGQDVYLVDSKTGAETDLKAGSYNFTADAGVDNARFSLKYQKTLKVDAPAFNDNSISVYADNGSLFVNSKSAAISNVTVYDVQGRIIAQKGNVKSTTAVINNLRANNQVLIVKIEGEDNSVVTKKLLN